VGTGLGELDLVAAGLDETTEKDVYILLTNGSPTSSVVLPYGALSLSAAAPRGLSEPAHPDGIVEHDGTHDGIYDRAQSSPSLRRGKPGYFDVPLPEESGGFSRSSVPRSVGSVATVGDQQNFVADYQWTDDTVSATLRFVSDPITVASDESRVLEIWVADHAWHDGGSAARRITQEMVDEMARRFLTAGSDNDIYDWVRRMIGAEWGPHSVSGLIPRTDRISILLLDIDADNATDHGVLGYYHSRDSHLQSVSASSNARIMFYMDSVFYACADAGASSWSADHQLPAEILSTLAHELQHMVHYYQKRVLRGSATRTWLNEMVSLAVEDMVARRLGVPGPRGVPVDRGDSGEAGITVGRLPRYNLDNTRSLTTWSYDADSVCSDYAASYSFAAFLLRNYPGEALLRDIVQARVGDYRAVVAAVTNAGGDISPYDPEFAFSQLILNWGIAGLISDVPAWDYPLEYNTGSWIGSDLAIGSIDLYKYEDIDTGLVGPRFYSPNEIGSRVTTSEPASNTFVYAGRYEPGQMLLSWSFEVPSGLSASVVVHER
jgi:hypothetical protein